jgi:Tfp pilus assembly protein PilN
MAQPMKRGNGMAGRYQDAGTATAATTESSTAWQRADDMTESLGGGMKTLAGTLREQVPGGPMGQMAAGVAYTLEQTGSYLEREGLSGVSDDLTHLVRNYPLQSLLVSAGVGFLLAQTCGGRR